LVQAVRNGWVLMCDEADKAPLEVVCVLKGLMEDGQMQLADGRCILAHGVPAPSGQRAESVIRIHPNFRMLALANRPGFPFLGNPNPTPTPNPNPNPNPPPQATTSSASAATPSPCTSWTTPTPPRR
jgi:hypothetical protein